MRRRARVHVYGMEANRSDAAQPDALVRLAARMTAGDGLAPLVRTWAVCTALFLVALALVVALS